MATIDIAMQSTSEEILSKLGLTADKETLDSIKAIVEAGVKVSGTVSAVKKVQAGTVTVSSASTAITLSSVNVNKSFVVVSAYGTQSGASYHNVLAYLASATKLTIENDFGSGMKLYVAWQVVEFY